MLVSRSTASAMPGAVAHDCAARIANGAEMARSRASVRLNALTELARGHRFVNLRTCIRASLSDGFRALGVASGDVVMVHASLRAVGEIAGGPDEVHLALKDCLTMDGTLMMYAGCPQCTTKWAAAISRRTRRRGSRQAAAVRSRDREIGARPRRAGGAASHVAWQPHQSPCDAVRRLGQAGGIPDFPAAVEHALGAGSALERFAELDGKILLLGCDHDTVTFLHYAEHIVDIPGKRIARYLVPIEEDGHRVWRHQEEVDSSNARTRTGRTSSCRDYDGSYLAAHPHGRGRVGNAASYLPSAKAC